MLIILTIICSFKILIHLKVYQQYRHLPKLSDEITDPPAEWPKLSIMIPACNEEDTVEETLQRLLSIDYPDYEVIVVNDRSIDQTGTLLDRIAADHHHLKVIHITTLPEGWLGKVHALHVATQQASGQHLIFMDADVHVHPSFLKVATAYVEHHRLDYLSAIPHFKGSSSLLRSLIFAFGFMFLATTRLGGVNRDQRGAFGGVGVFQMMRASFFETTPGWEWLKLEIGDDMGMALMCHEHGSKARFLNASELLSLSWYPSAVALMRGLEKNSFPVAARFSVIRAILLCALILSLILGPWLLLCLGYTILGGVFLITEVAFALSAPPLGASRLERLCSPFTSLLLIIAVMRSMWKTLRQGGVMWRGTLYPTSALKEGQRLKW